MSIHGKSGVILSIFCCLLLNYLFFIMKNFFPILIFLLTSFNFVEAGETINDTVQQQDTVVYQETLESQTYTGDTEVSINDNFLQDEEMTFIGEEENSELLPLEEGIGKSINIIPTTLLACDENVYVTVQMPIDVPVNIYLGENLISEGDLVLIDDTSNGIDEIDSVSPVTTDFSIVIKRGPLHIIEIFLVNIPDGFEEAFSLSGYTWDDVFQFTGGSITSGPIIFFSGNHTVIDYVVNPCTVCSIDSQPDISLLASQTTFPEGTSRETIFSSIVPTVVDPDTDISLLVITNDSLVIFPDEIVMSGTYTLTYTVSDPTSEILCEDSASISITVENSGGGGGGGGGSRRRGEVLGATSCEPYLTQYLRIENVNDVEEVKKLQEFLNDYMEESLVVSGVFDTETYEAVKRFQQKEKVEVLDPWNNLTEPTGYVYITTLRRINMIKCPELNLEVPLLKLWKTDSPTNSNPTVKPSSNFIVAIPSIDLYESVVTSGSLEEAGDSLWHSPFSMYPKEESGNIVIVGHRYKNLVWDPISQKTITVSPRPATFFSLPKVVVGDSIYVSFDGTLHTYVVQDVLLVDETEVWIEDQTDQNMLTLYTCAPLFESTKRHVVRAILVE